MDEAPGHDHTAVRKTISDSPGMTTASGASARSVGSVLVAFGRCAIINRRSGSVTAGLRVRRGRQQGRRSEAGMARPHRSREPWNSVRLSTARACGSRSQAELKTRSATVSTPSPCHGKRGRPMAENPERPPAPQDLTSWIAASTIFGVSGRSHVIIPAAPGPGTSGNASRRVLTPGTSCATSATTWAPKPAV